MESIQYWNGINPPARGFKKACIKNAEWSAAFCFGLVWFFFFLLFVFFTLNLLGSMSKLIAAAMEMGRCV